ncbi:hypothetical protein BJ138DRAFT_1196463 [Hygrophoropsis aurantiaca]|uniref:Uncharacterized protein n=1 Tax=Hygrophoropsis aurantiaca TaxID=72124 RepID=A0ACB7ZPR0_9AGAM|nr:hypothetical protein BJ138DRAFT_1196463 [Hygrophoropsis aurantiaca]
MIHAAQSASSQQNLRELQDIILASEFSSVTWSTRTTTVEETITVNRDPRAATVHAVREIPLIPPSPQSSPQSSPRESITELSVQNPLENEALLVPDPLYVPAIPHPNNIRPPAPDLLPDGYYVVTVGQEVGIFYQWPDVAERTQNISGSTYKKYKHFHKAKAAYTRAFNSNGVRAVPVYSGPFWRMRAVSPPPLPSPSLLSLSSDRSLWSQVDDLSVEMSQVTI